MPPAMTDTVLTDTRDGILTVTMNRPEAMNAFVPELLERLTEVMAGAATDDAVRVVVLRGAGRAFSAGVDLKVLRTDGVAAGHVPERFDRAGIGVARAMRGCPKPVIARVHGYCFTGALELALMADTIYLTEGTKLGDTHAKFGLRPSWGMSQTLPDAIGLRRAKDLSFTGRTFTGAEAYEWGLAAACCPDEAALDALTAERAAMIAENSPGAVAAYKDLYALAAERRPLADALEEEVRRQYDIQDTADRLAGFKR